MAVLKTYSNKARDGRSTSATVRSGPMIQLTSMASHSMSRVRRCATAIRTRTGGGVTPASPKHVSHVFIRIKSRMSGKRGLMRVSTTGLGRVGLRLRGRRARFEHVSRLCGINKTSGSR